jgi:hypothetical protein
MSNVSKLTKLASQDLAMKVDESTDDAGVSAVLAFVTTKNGDCQGYQNCSFIKPV